MTIDETDKLGDADTADLFTEISRGIDKWLWFVEDHSQAAKIETRTVWEPQNEP